MFAAFQERGRGEVTCKSHRQFHGKQNDVELYVSTLAFGRGGTTWTGLDTGVLSRPCGLGEILFSGSFFRFSLIYNLKASV